MVDLTRAVSDFENEIDVALDEHKDVEFHVACQSIQKAISHFRKELDNFAIALSKFELSKCPKKHSLD